MGDLMMRSLVCITFALSAFVEALPNFIIVNTDDQGYADAGVYGAKDFETPNLDQMAREGLRFTNFYCPANACSPSRAALLTGCYPVRVGVPHVLGPSGMNPNRPPSGLHPDEVTIADLLKTQGYATACVGKWHLGDQPQWLPTNQGFDSFFGLPYSNDMWPKHPTAKGYPDLPLLEGTEILETNPDMNQLTTRYTERSLEFIRKNHDKPFFLYLAHSMPHVPLGVSEKFRGVSKQGMYGDVIMEIDWSVGEIIRTLKELGIDDNTMVVFTSDNGPWLSYGNHAGSALPLREGKGTTWDGGHRVPCIVRWPNKIPAGQTSDVMVANFDFLPTIAARTGAPLAPGRKIDGKDLWPVLTGMERTRSPHDAFYFYRGPKLVAIRQGNFKLHRPHPYRSLDGRAGGRDGLPVKYDQLKTSLALYDMDKDIGERKNLAGQHTDLVGDMEKQMQAFEQEIKRESRPAGTLSTGK
jgi:arylsulfatase A